jgi:hypothetical protein
LHSSPPLLSPVRSRPVTNGSDKSTTAKR